MAITSSTDICNLALDLLSAGTVNDVDNPTTPTEEIMNRWYDQCRRKLLREHPWNFATKRRILSPDSTDPKFGYAAQFSVPADFVRVLALSTNLSIDREVMLPKDAYQFENNKLLLNGYYEDATALNLIYVYDFTNVSSMDAMFVELLAYEIALATAYKITETNTNIQRIDELAKQKKALAKSIDGQERPPVRIERSRALAARRSAGRARNSHRTVF